VSDTVSEQQGRSGAEAVGRVCEALEELATVLGRADLDGLLAAEAELESAAADVAMLASLPMEQRRALREEAEAARRALMRCERLGSSLTGFARASLEARGAAVGYDADGYDPAPAAAAAMHGRGFQTRA
jgi:hypothetical protein